MRKHRGGDYKVVLGADRIIHLIREGVTVEDHVTGQETKKPLIEHLGSDQIEGIEGTTVDLRLGAIYKPVGRARLMRESRITPEIEKIMDISDSPDGMYGISPGEYLLFQTIEQINLPENLFAYIRPRTTLIRSGIPLMTAFVSPNYQGKLTVGMKHEGIAEVEIQMGFRILCIAFFPIEGNAVPYRGVWQGDRISTDGKKERPF
jgi:dUTP pyrophosphatase